MTDPRAAAVCAGALIAEAELAAVPGWIWDGVDLPVPIDHIAENVYGFLVEERDLAQAEPDRYLSGLLDPIRRRIAVDRLEAARAPGRRRFTVAHELGHWVIHQQPSIRTPDRRWEPQQPVGVGDVLSDELEWLAEYPSAEVDANQFAAAMLMPRGLLGSARRRSPDLDELAECFAVSRHALERRVAFLDALRRAQ